MKRITKLVVVFLTFILMFACFACKQKSVTFAENKIEISVDEEYQLFAITTPTNEAVIYSSKNKAIATVDSNGVVYGISPGNTVIEASIDSGKTVAFCTVRVIQSYGSISGESSYSYIGGDDYPDSSCFVLLISKKLTAFPEDYNGGERYEEYEEKGLIYYMKTDSKGRYEFNNVPIGEYRLIFRSYNGTPNGANRYVDQDTLIEKVYGEELAKLLKGYTPKQLGLLITDTKGYDIKITKDCKLTQNALFVNLYG